MKRPELLNTCWVNIWSPAQQAPLVELLEQHYDFSPRLLALMISRPSQPPRSSLRGVENSHQWFRRRQVQVSSAKPDVEKGLDRLSELLELSSVSSYDSAATCNLYKVVNELWHYSSVDFRWNYVCIGYNSLYGTKCAGEEPGDGLIPHCTRVWTWLTLCEDNTIISINEDPFPFSGCHLDLHQQQTLSETRHNIINIFRSISSNEAGSAMAQLPIRSRLGTTQAETSHRPTNVPVLLFYYLFENWKNSYILITRRPNRYALELRTLRSEMFTTPKLHHIDRLDNIGKELGLLKRHYAAYNRIIDRLLEPQTATTASLQNTRANTEASQSSLSAIRPVTTEKENLRVSLSSPAHVRFKRLRDLMDLYALSEVEEHIMQDSLVSMNFSLIVIKESLDVERLTRLTLLLTKVTMIFLPVTLMTAYFSVPLQGVEYGVREFWASFAVVLCLSGGALFVFGLVSGTAQAFAVVRGMIVRQSRPSIWRVPACTSRRLLE